MRFSGTRSELLVTEEEELTRDVIFDGALSIWQRRRGYRFGIDSILLATDLPDVPEDSTVIDLGAGQGAVALTVAHQNPQMKVIAVERQQSLLELLRRNIEENELTNVEVIDGDLRQFRDLLEPHCADLVVSNPPFYPGHRRRPSPRRERAEARHELHGGVADFIAAAAYALNQRGWLQMITPPIRMMEAMTAAQTTDLRPGALRFFHSCEDDDAYLVEYRWRRGAAPDFSIRPPLFIYESDRVYSREVARRLQRERR